MVSVGPPGDTVVALVQQWSHVIYCSGTRVPVETSGDTVVALWYTVGLPGDIVVTLEYQSSHQDML